MENQPLRVLHVNSSASWRGGERQTLLCARELERLGVESFIAAPAASPLAVNASAAGLAVFPLNMRGWQGAAGIFRLQRLVRRLRPEIVHAHTSHAHTVAAAALTGIRDVSLVVTRRVDTPMAAGFLRRLKYGRCDGIIAISRKIRDNLIEGGVPGHTVVCIHSGVDLAKYEGRKAAPDVRAEFGFPGNAIVVGCVAALTREKDHETLLRAARRVLTKRDDVRFVLVGDGERRSGLEKCADALGIRGNVTFTGHRHDADMLVAGFDIFAFPSRSEGLGSSVLDAMAAGTAVAASDTGGIPEMIEHEKSGLLFAAGSDEECAGCILRLAENGRLRRALADAAKIRVRDFDIGKCVGETTALYRKIRAGRTRP
jgi:glycosyltransferase involved in cell wall biosynthesis